MSFEQYLADKKTLIVVFDDALYPQKDYLLQVYYLFSEFMAYSAQLDAKEMIDFMGTAYAAKGEEAMFEKTAEKFEIPTKYKHNFDLLHETARLPLKLLPYQNVLSLMQEAVINRQQLVILAEGKPEIVINKIKQMEWYGLQNYMKLYFTAEYNHSVAGTVAGLLDKESIKEAETVMLVPADWEGKDLAKFNISCVPVTEIL